MQSAFRLERLSFYFSKYIVARCSLLRRKLPSLYFFFNQQFIAEDGLSAPPPPAPHQNPHQTCKQDKSRPPSNILKCKNIPRQSASSALCVLIRFTGPTFKDGLQKQKQGLPPRVGLRKKLFSPLRWMHHFKVVLMTRLVGWISLRMRQHLDGIVCRSPGMALLSRQNTEHEKLE